MPALERRAEIMWKPLAIVAALLFMYSSVLWKLGYDWWTDDNYSHGLLIPFLIAFVVAFRIEEIRSVSSRPLPFVGLSMVSAASLLLLMGTMTSVLFAQRFSLVLIIAGLAVCFFGFGVLRRLGVPFLLLLLAIPIPQIIFNKIAFPLQLLASRFADQGLQLLGVPVERFGNVMDIPFATTGEIVSLEVVEACSGIRSLMTLVTLALVLGYFTREENGEPGSVLGSFSPPDAFRTGLLMASAVPIALITNAGRVIATGFLARWFGRDGVEGIWHDVSGAAVFIAAIGLLIGLNFIVLKVLERRDRRILEYRAADARLTIAAASVRKTLFILVVLLLCGAFVNWFQYRGEVRMARRQLREIPAILGGWEQRNDDIRFDDETEKVLKATDYVMRDYYGPGKRLNLYIGYYESQRSGSTYHSPLSCLPGTGWEIAEPRSITISLPSGEHFTANLYTVRQGEHEEYMIYWYQGRGRRFVSEYEDKLYTSLDSLLERRSDGGMIRIMTPVGADRERSLAAAVDLSSLVAERIGEFLPD